MTSPTSKVQVLRHDTLQVVGVDPLALRWWVPQSATEVRTGLLRHEMERGDAPYLPVRIHWSTKVTVLSGLPRPWWAKSGWGKREAKRVLRAGLERRDGGCFYCGSGGALTVEHLVPRAHGGPDTPENLTVACRACNGVLKDAALAVKLAVRDELRRVAA